MKAHTFIFAAAFLILAANALAQQPAAAPRELALLRASFKSNVQRALIPLNARYLNDLQALKATLTRAGKLQGALAVDREVERMKAVAGGGAYNPPVNAVPTQATEDPAELIALRIAYTGNIWTATAPITSRFLSDLESLKAQYTRSANLQGAVAADEEIKTIRLSAAVTPQAGLDKLLADTTWDFPFEAGERRLIFGADGTTTSSWTDRKRPYRQVNAFVIEIIPWTEADLVVTLQFDPTYSAAVVVHDQKGISTGVKLTRINASAPAPAFTETQDLITGTSWPRKRTGNRVEFNADNTFVEVWNNNSMPGRYKLTSKNEATVIYSSNGKAKSHTKHFRVTEDGQAIERLEDRVTWPK